MVDAVSDMIVRYVKVDRTRAPQAALDAMGWRQYIDPEVVAMMPRGDGEEVEVIFFRVGHFVSDDDLEREYELRGLKQADPYSVMAVNENDLSFSEDHSNGTHWKDADGKWCYVAFYPWHDGHRVAVHRYDDNWRDFWWFAGLRK